MPTSRYLVDMWRALVCGHSSRYILALESQWLCLLSKVPAIRVHESQASTVVRAGKMADNDIGSKPNTLRETPEQEKGQGVLLFVR